ncbi:MAG TPA: hypothetical protein VN759_11905 [Pseudolysinimonas sp.]|nr:hypothetical protein [Pseudolysinimonas sp.]
MRRVVVRWVAAFVVVALAGVGSIVVLDLTAAGPGAFVGAYLDALARRDAASALAMPGVHRGTADTQLLTAGALPGLSGIHQVDDVVHDGIHRITMDWVSAGVPGETTFEVRPAGTRFGVVPAWAFAESPLAALSLEVQNSRTFDAGDVAARTPGVGPAEYAVLVPGVYTVSHASTFLTADPVRITADTVGQDLSATVDVEANAHFVHAVQTEVDRHLRECATQHVLFPTGCPFGEQIDNRVASTPMWTIVHDPDIRLVGAGDDVAWRVPSVPATAHLKVDVKSLFDGTMSTFDQDVPFTASFTVTIDADDRLTITAVY